MASATKPNDGRRLVVVESPAKARTIAGYLGRDYVVESSIGHIRDLPRNAADVPARLKGQPWARLGVDVDNGFAPLYVITPDKKDQVAKLKALLKGAAELYLATDEDREGEAIAWHLLEVLDPKVPVRRMVFHEITPAAIRAAIESPRELNRALVDAQETRRILDRLYGYELSPVLWKKVMPKLSAGRVQSVATRILVERERARMAFRSAGYWDVEGLFDIGREPADPADPRTFTATLVSLDGRRVAAGRDFGTDGGLRTGSAALVVDEDRARSLAEELGQADFAVRSVERRPYRRSPYPPFMTSTLQQEAARKLRMSSATTMRVAQRLYENGHITYMRTDSTTLSETALAAARESARQLYGARYVPESPRLYHKKVKNAQEAHEAIRPSGDTFLTPAQLSGALAADELRLYELIWQRTVASQMADATGSSAAIRLGAVAGGVDAEFAATGKVIDFPGFLRAYVEGSDDPDADLEDRERRLPPVSAGDPLIASHLEPRGHVTSPPARFTEASLVKRLEELGVGRPSTYAAILATIQDRGYVFKKGTALVPSFIAFAVVGLLERHFGQLVDYAFTASLEDDLDEIAAGNADSTDWLDRFWFGSEHGHAGGIARGGGLKAMVQDRLGEIDAREVNSIPIGPDGDGDGIVVRVGRYGPYVQRGDVRASLPENLPPDELTVERAEELLDAPRDERVLGSDPDSGSEVMVKSGRYGPYVTTTGADGSVRRASLLATMSPETVTLESALALLRLPRHVGVDPSDGAEVVAGNGRYGPYVKKGAEFRSLPDQETLFTVTLAEAAAPKVRRGGRATAAPALRELGPDPVTGSQLVVREGRFGPYVTDGETNASLRKGDEVAGLTAERAAELLADRRGRGPAKPRPARRRTAAPAKPARPRRARSAGSPG